MPISRLTLRPDRAPRPRWRAQAIVFFVLALVGLIGIAGLAIDGGRLALEKRRAQAAADAAALAGGLSIAYAPVQADGTVSATALQAALDAARERAAANGYDDDGVHNTVQVTIDGPVQEGFHWVYYVNVDIDSNLDPALIQVVYSGPLRASVHAQSRARPYQDFARGYTIVTTGDKSPGLQIGGDSLIDVEGDIWVNTWTRLNGSFTLQVDTLYSVGRVENLGSASTLVGEVQANLGTPRTWPTIPEPACGPDRGSIQGARGGTYAPGTYSHIHINSDAEVHLEPGLYCVDHEVIITGGAVYGEGVMFYVRSGVVRLAGEAQVHLTAASNLTDAAGQQWRGMLFYLSPDNHDGFELRGTSEFYLDGTVYVPGEASREACAIAATSGTMSLQAQFICHSAEVVGTADMQLRQPSVAYHVPPVLDLTE